MLPKIYIFELFTDLTQTGTNCIYLNPDGKLKIVMIDLEGILPIPVHLLMLQLLLHERWELQPFEDSAELSECITRGTLF